MGVVAVPLVSQ